MSADAQLSVRILDREYRMACSEGEQAELEEAARLLDQRMREIKRNAKLLSADRVAVLAGLELAHELLKLQNERKTAHSLDEARLAALRERLDRVLGSP